MEGQERSDDPEATYVDVDRDVDVDRTIEISDRINVDVDASGRVHGIELIGAMQWWDMYQQVLRVLPQKIHEAAYRAGREDAAREVEEWGSGICAVPAGHHLVKSCARIARGSDASTEVNRPRTPEQSVGDNTP